MRKFFVFEIEADEKPILAFGEWEESITYTTDVKLAQEENVVAYGEIKDGRYIELFKK